MTDQIGPQRAAPKSVAAIEAERKQVKAVTTPTDAELIRNLRLPVSIMPRNTLAAAADRLVALVAENALCNDQINLLWKEKGELYDEVLRLRKLLQEIADSASEAGKVIWPDYENSEALKEKP